MSNLDINWYPAQGQGRNGFMGSGFITAGAFRVNFSVFKNEKFTQGFSIRLPGGRKNPNTNEWINEVSFANREVSDAIYAKIAELIRTGASSAPQQEAQQATSQQNIPTSVDIQNTANQVKAPF